MMKTVLLMLFALMMIHPAAQPLPPNSQTRPPIPERDHPQDVFHHRPGKAPAPQPWSHPPETPRTWYWAHPKSHPLEHKLPENARMAIVDGVSYAIINGYFYRQQQQRYVYQPQSPLNKNKITIVEGAQSHRRERTITLTKKPEIGSIVQQLPKDAIAVSIANAHYWVKDSSWYIKRAEDGRFAVVQSPLE